MSGPAIYGARARIHLSAIRHNLETVRGRAPGSLCMAVIKANAYGHGLVEVARALESADCFAVARFAEAERLRAADICNDIVVMGVCIIAAFALPLAVIGALLAVMVYAVSFSLLSLTGWL